jgi:hypothetical protein
MAIFLMALVAVVPLMNMGLERATETELRSIGLQKAQSKMSEVIAGAVSMGSQANVPFDEDPDGKWTWSMEASQQGNINNLWLVTITVSYPVGDEEIQIKLTEMVRDPSILPPWTSNQLISLQSTSSTTSSSSSSGSSTTGGNGP